MRRVLLGISLVLVIACAPPRQAAPSGANRSAVHTRVDFELRSDRGLPTRVPRPGAALTVLDFWAPSCQPCRVKIPALVAREGELVARGAELVLVAALSEDETLDDARATLRGWGVDRTFLVDHGGLVFLDLELRALPATLLLNARGEVVWVAGGRSSAPDVLRAVDRERDRGQRAPTSD